MRALLAAVIALPLAAAALLLLAPGPGADGAAFQGLVGGLGLGPAVDLSRCASDFDPRIDPGCSLRHDPLPLAFCPSHAHR